jgi:hypothetical protein
MKAAIKVIAVMTLVSGLHVAFRMRETHRIKDRAAEQIATPMLRL